MGHNSSHLSTFSDIAFSSPAVQEVTTQTAGTTMTRGRAPTKKSTTPHFAGKTTAAATRGTGTTTGRRTNRKTTPTRKSGTSTTTTTGTGTTTGATGARKKNAAKSEETTDSGTTSR